MLIRIGYKIAFNFPAAVPMMLLLRLHPSREQSIREPESFKVDPALTIHEFIDSYGNRCGKTFAPAGRVVFENNAVVGDDGLPDPQSAPPRT